VTRAAAIVASLLVVLAGAAVAQAQVPLPSQDPFYAVPPEIAGLPNGTILKSRAVAVSALGLPLGVTAWQLEYKSLDAQNQPTAMVTTVMVPLTPWKGPLPRPLLSYQFAEDGADSKCAPSYALHAGVESLLTQSNASAETTLMAQTLSHGWAVAAPDYQGPDSHFLAAPEEAHGVLDGIRAALAFRPAGFVSSTPIGMLGYSGGGYATSVAALFQRSYAPDVKLAGAAIGAPAVDVRAEIQAFSGTIAGGAIAMGIAALDRAYPERHLQQYLNAAGQQAVAQSEHDCLAEAAEKHPFASMQQWEAQPNALKLPAVTSFLNSISPRFMPGHPTIPVFEYHDAADEFAPLAPALDTMNEWCARGSTVDMHVQPGGEHIAYESVGLPLAMAYLTDRFAGKPAPSTCQQNPAPASGPQPLRRLVLGRGPLRLDRRGRITLRVRNPNGFKVTLVTAAVRVTRLHHSLLRRTMRIAIARRRTRAIRLHIGRAALHGHGRLGAQVQLTERTSDGRTATSSTHTVLVQLH
jgi:hypothetical protein